MLRRLSFRFMLAIGLMTALLVAVITSITWNLHSAHLDEEVTRQAATLSQTILLSLRDQMLANRRSQTDAIIEQIGTQERIERIRIFDKSSVALSTDPDEEGEPVDLNAAACHNCHVEGTPRVVLQNPERTYSYQCATHGRILGMITPIYNEPDCSSAPCHAHSPDTNILGVLDVSLSMQITDQSLEEESRKFIFVGILSCLLIVGATGGLFWSQVAHPIHDLTVGTRELSSGNLSYRIPAQHTQEFSDLARSFNRMTKDLHAAREEVLAWSRELESRVEEKTHELQEAQDRMVQTEKMASLGKLAAVVAHEINNPVAGILTYVKLLRKMVKRAPEKFDAEKADRNLEMMESETVRVGNIVKNLLAFSRPSRPGQDEADIRGIVRRALELLDHQMDLNGIEYDSHVEDNLPTIKGDPALLQQALLAILINAVEAMHGGGRIDVSVAYDRATENVILRVADTGIGIQENDLAHLFEPFFTTKAEVKGVGLGLFVVYGIIRRHGGTIDVESEVNKGTTFIISLPKEGAQDDTETDERTAGQAAAPEAPDRGEQ